MSHDPFTAGDATIGHHAATCGTSTTHPGHCQLDCNCWCHYGPVIVIRYSHAEDRR